METVDVLAAGAVDASVRTAVPADVGAIGAVHARSWRRAYADLLPVEVLAALDPSALARAWAAAVASPPSPGHRVVVACAGSTVVGFAAVDAAGELVALLVDPAHQRRGHGSRLLSAAVDHLRAVGASPVVAWCPLDDLPRRAFLTSAGLAPDGAWRELEVPGAAGGLREVRLVAWLGGPDATASDAAESGAAESDAAESDVAKSDAGGSGR